MVIEVSLTSEYPTVSPPDVLVRPVGGAPIPPSRRTAPQATRSMISRGPEVGRDPYRLAMKSASNGTAPVRDPGIRPLGSLTSPLSCPSRVTAVSASPEPLRLMAVHAHPDDESSKGAASTVRYVPEGVEVMVVTCTGGERGDIFNPNFVDDPEILANLTEVRRREMDRARQILGVRQEWLGFVDSGYVEDYTIGDRDALPDDCFAPNSG